MTRVTFKVLFYVKHTKQLKDGSLPIFARITVNKQRLEFGLQRSVLSDQWDSNRGQAKANSKKNKEVNAYLETVRTNLYLKRREMEDSGQAVTADSLRQAYQGLDRIKYTLMKIFADHNEKCRQLINIDYSHGTFVKYDNCYRHLAAFLQTKYNKSDVAMIEVNAMFIGDFELYLKTAGGCCHNTTLKYINNLKKIVRIALANGWTKVDPFARIKLKYDEVDMAYLDEKELSKLIKKQFSIVRLQQVKDVYVFCCMTGLSFGDAKSLCSDDIIHKDNQLWIKKKRQKTKNWCHIPLLEPALHILEKYKFHPHCIKKGLLLPVLSNQKMNAYLKEIADLCGIEKHLSTHTARHTFATTVTLANQVSIEVVSKMLGHSSINMTKKYARVVDDLIKRDMEKIFQKFERVGVN